MNLHDIANESRRRQASIGERERQEEHLSNQRIKEFLGIVALHPGKLPETTLAKDEFLKNTGFSFNIFAPAVSRVVTPLHTGWVVNEYMESEDLVESGLFIAKSGVPYWCGREKEGPKGKYVALRWPSTEHAPAKGALADDQRYQEVARLLMKHGLI